MGKGPLAQAIKALYNSASKANPRQLKDLSLALGEHALIEDDTTYTQIAAIAYCLAKIGEKHYLSNSQEWNAVLERVMARLKAAEIAVQTGRLTELPQLLEDALSLIEHYTLEKGLFKGSLVEKARVRIGTDIYAHGASLGRAAELAGTSKRALLSYIGMTKIPNKYFTQSVDERLTEARKLFLTG